MKLRDYKGRGGFGRSFHFRKNDKADLAAGFLLAASCLLAFVLYWPGLYGPFVLDDFNNLAPLGYYGGVSSVKDALAFIFGNSSGPLGRPISMASFLLDSNDWPASPYPFKLTNLYLHLATGLAAFLALRRLVFTLGSPPTKNYSSITAALVVSIWLVHPLNLSTTLYVIQRMAVLSAFFSLLSVYFYLDLRVAVRAGRGCSLRSSCSALFACAFGGAAVLSKENSLLLIPFFVILEVYFFSSRRSLPSYSCAATFLLALGAFSLYLLTQSRWSGAYELRDFTVLERLAYEVFALGDYALKILLPQISQLNLVNGDFETVGLADLAAMYWDRVIVFFVLLVGMAALYLRRVYIPAAGLAWFFVFHLAESSFIGLELYFEHRNYLPAIGLILSIVSLLASAMSRIRMTIAVKSLCFLSYFGFLTFSTFLLSVTWGSADRLFLKWEMDEPNSVRAKVMYASHLDSIGFHRNALEHIDRAIAIFPENFDLQVRKLRHACDADNADAFYKAMSVIRRNRLVYSLGATYSLKQIVKFSNLEAGTYCAEIGKGVSLEGLFSAAERSRKFAARKADAAQFYALKSDYFAYRKDLEKSKKALEHALHYTPTVDLYIKLAVMNASAGLYSESIKNLRLASAADDRRRGLLPSRTKEIEALIEQISGFSDNLD